MMSWRSTASVVICGTLLLGPWPAVAQEDDEPQEEVRGSSAAFDLQGSATETVWVDEGSPLFESPDPASRRVAVIDVLSELEVIESRGEWRRVRYQTRIGWVQPDLATKDRVIEINERLEPLTVEMPGIDTQSLGRLELARQLLGTAGTTRQLGPYALLTDVEDDRLLTELDQVAAGLATSYRERYGLDLGEPADQAVALFANEKGYREFERGTTEGSDTGRHGHAIGDLASLYLQDRRLAEERALLVHELTHLMNRRALGPQPPSWIEEGLANDLAYSRVGRNGELRLGTLEGNNDVFGPRFDRQIVFTGGLASLSQLLKARPRRQGSALDDLVEMDQKTFMAPGERQLHYAESAFLIRLLLDGPHPEWGEGFRRYLGELAAGRQPDALELATMLGANWPEIERTFDAWLRVQAAQLLR